MRWWCVEVGHGTALHEWPAAQRNGHMTIAAGAYGVLGCLHFGLLGFHVC